MPSTASLLSAGLYTLTDTEATVPLVGVAVDAEVTGLCARVSVAHRYINREGVPIEAVYVFPLDEGAAVCGFEAVIDGVVIVGQVLEREAAFERYDDAMERGDGAFLLDEHRPDVFQASIGNLPPGREVLVRLSYVTELVVDEGRLRFTLPTTLAPKYAPPADHQGLGQPDAEALSPPVAWSVPYGLDLRVRISMPGGVSGVASPSHPVDIAFTDGQAVVTLGSAQAALDRDFILTVDVAALRAPCAWVERHGEDTAIAVGFVPALDEVPGPADIVFVVDRSGSMEGDPIAEVRNALQLCLRSMTTGCCFNIVSFGSTYQALFKESRAYDQASLEAATRYVTAMDADLGGTEMEPALRFVLTQGTRSGLPRQVVVLTDGAVTNTDEVIALAAAHRTTARVFTFGIGNAASQHLVRGLARAGGGAAEFIHPGERIEARVMRQFARLLAPAMTDARLEWVGGDVRSVPTDLPPLFGGQRLLTYGLVTGGMPSAARLTATLPSGVRAWDVAVSATPTAGTVVTTLAARTRIRELEEGPDWTRQAGSLQRGRKRSAVRQQIVDLAVRHGLASRETSFVAVEHRATAVTGDTQLRRVPVMLAHGWGGLTRPGIPGPMSVWLPTRAADFLARAGDALDDCALVPMGDGYSRPVQARSVTTQSRKRWAAGIFDVAFGARRPPTLDRLVALQDADGSWALTSDFAHLVGRDLPELEAYVPASADARRRAWATALAVVWLQVHASGWKDEWQLLAAKAHGWLSGQPADGDMDWLDRARRLFTDGA